MAPEMSQNTGQPLQLKPTDIFSLGITLAESLSGRNKLGFPGSLRGKTYQDLLNAARNLTRNNSLELVNNALLFSHQLLIPCLSLEKLLNKFVLTRGSYLNSYQRM